VSDYETAERRRNIIVGIFVIGAICALIWLIFQFRDLPGAVTKLGSFSVFVQFPTAPGVQKDTPVQFCGYQIGRVAKVMYPEPRRDLNTGLKYHQTLVVLSIDKKHTNIPSNIEVKLITRGLGSSFIELKVDPESLPAPPRDPNRPETQFLVDGMPLQGSTGMTSEFFPEESQKKFEDLIDTVNTLTKNLNDVVSDPNNKGNFKAMLANISEASEQATKTFEEFQNFSNAGTKFLKSFEADVDKLVTAMATTSEELSKTLVEMRVTLEKINSGQGSAGKFVNDAQLFEVLVETSEEIRKMMEELRSFLAKANEKGSMPIKLK
jgi:phospholipid/cholesterol/gamma-HCH transport system substrate-binding protein